jgi:DNA repair protein RecO (recombination protein O)
VQTNLESAFVLHRRSYRESSLLVEFFSEQHGRVGAIARGFARAGGVASLQPFQSLLVSWSSRRGELVALTHAEAASGMPKIGGAAALCGFYLNEMLLQALQRHDPHPVLFHHYTQALNALSRSDADTEMILRWFEKGLLEEVGYAVNLEQDMHERDIDPAQGYLYLPGQGAVPDDGATRPREALAVSGATLLALARGEALSADARQEAKRLMRGLLRAHLGDKPVFSRSWFAEY